MMRIHISKEDSISMGAYQRRQFQELVDIYNEAHPENVAEIGYDSEHTSIPLMGLEKAFIRLLRGYSACYRRNPVGWE